MASLSFMESAKDKMSRLSGNPFSDHVEEATSDLLLVQDSEKIAILIHFGNQGGEHVAELLNAVRRRIDHKNPKVQCFTVVVLDALIRNCSRDLHVELATNQKGLLRDLVLLAAKESTREAEFKAKELAATLVVNCSYWFARHPDDKVREVLSGLIDHVRAAGGVLDGITPEPEFQIRLDHARPAAAGGNSINGADDEAVPARARQAPQRTRTNAAPQQQPQQQGPHGPHHPQRSRQQQVVDAIPIVCPPDEELNGMMEAVLLLVECLNGTPPQEVPRNEMLNSIVAQVRQQHQHVASLVAVATANNIEIANLESLRSVNDSQVEVLAQHTEIVLHHGPPRLPSQVDADEAAAIAASLEDMRRTSGGGGAAEPSVITQMPSQQHPATSSPPTTTTTTSNDPNGPNSYRARLTRYYEFYNPGKLKEVDTVLAKFEGREEQMMRQLQAKYGAEPQAPAPQEAPPAPAPAQPVAASQPPPPAPAPAVVVAPTPTIDELFAAAMPPPPPPPAPQVVPVDVFAAQDVKPVAEPAVAPVTVSPPAKAPRSAQDIDEPAPAAPVPPPAQVESAPAPTPAAPTPAPTVAAPAYAFPPMGQNLDPKRNEDAPAMQHSDEPKATEGTRSASRPADDDFDAFLNARLTH